MDFLKKEEITKIVTNAIAEKKILLIKYQHKTGAKEIVSREMSPFDIGTTNSKTILQNKNNLYLFCSKHIDEKTGLALPMVHPISMEHIISIKETGKYFNEIELADIHLVNSNYDYRLCSFAVIPKRNWFMLSPIK